MGLLLASGCAGEGSPVGTDPGPEPPAGSFAQVQSEIFDRSCTASACHNSTTRAGNLSLVAGESYDGLVAVPPDNPAARAAGMLRVTPGDVEGSFIMHKLTGALEPNMGAPMPLGAPALPDQAIELITSWIAAGALRDAESGAGEAPSFGELQTTVFDRRCTSGACHSAATRAGGLSLAPGDAWAALVGAEPENPSARGAGFLRVTPGSVDESFLIAKLTGDLAPGEGSMMPLGSPPLPDAEIDLIRRWIAAGAPDA